MCSEEKLARDVYITLGTQWDLTQFKKIARSEQRHMNALKRLLIIYKLQYPIEDLDIKDLNEFLLQTTNPRVIRTYENLVRGSRNHLRAFVSALEERNETYTPQYISQEEFDEIISTPMERGRKGRNK